MTDDFFADGRKVFLRNPISGNDEMAECMNAKYAKLVAAMFNEKLGVVRVGDYVATVYDKHEKSTA